MMAKIFTLKFDNLLGIFDDEALQGFLKQKEVLSLWEHFFLKDDAPYLTIVVTYNIPSVDLRHESSKESGESWRSMLADDHIPLFNALRDWRQKKAREAGLPLYIIFNNAQLAAVAMKRPHTLNALSLIEGIGRAKIDKYGNELLKLLADSGIKNMNMNIKKENSQHTGTVPEKPVSATVFIKNEAVDND